MPSSIRRSPIPRLGPASSVADLFVGLGLPLRSVGVMFSTPKLLGLTLLASAVTGLTLVGLVVGAGPVSHRLAEALVGDGGWRSAAAAVLTVVFYVTLVVAGVLSVPNLLLAPLQDPMSEATEARCGDVEAPAFSVGRLVHGALVSVRHAVWRISLLLVGLLALLPLNLVPVAGSVAYAVTSALWAMWWLTAEYLSGPMARHLLPFRDVLRAMLRRRWLSFGFGAALYVMLWVPVVNFFLVPVAVVSGTLLFRALQTAGEVARPAV